MTMKDALNEHIEQLTSIAKGAHDTDIKTHLLHSVSAMRRALTALRKSEEGKLSLVAWWKQVDESLALKHAPYATLGEVRSHWESGDTPAETAKQICDDRIFVAHYLHNNKS